MSWSINLIGKPANIVAALEEESGKLTGQSKVEFDDALPHIVSLVKQNFANEEPYVEPVLMIEASGHGSAKSDDKGTRQVQRQCSVKIQHHYMRIV